MIDETAGLQQLLHAFHRMHHTCMRGELEQRGLQDPGNPAILFILSHHAGGMPITQREIADKLGVSPPNVANSIKRMERSGLVTKIPDENDLRKNCIALTEKGKTYTDGVLAAEASLYRRITAGFSSEETEALRKFYIRLIKNMGELGCRQPQFLKGPPPQL